MTREQIIKQIKSDFNKSIQSSKEKYKEYWFKRETIIGNFYEGVLLEIDHNDYVVLCTDGKIRLFKRMSTTQ